MKEVLQRISKKGWISIALSVVLIAGVIIIPNLNVHAAGYDYRAACNYADQWGGSNRNPNYYDYSNVGGDCQNYVSQCLAAGGLQTGGDWQVGTSSWVNVPTFVSTMQARGYQVIENPSAGQILPGNPVIYRWYGSNYWGHATICVGYDGNGTPIINGHTGDRYHVAWDYARGSASAICTIMINQGEPQKVNIGSPLDMGDEFYAEIISVCSGKPLTNQNGNVVITAEKSEPQEKKAQIWRITRLNDGTYSIINTLDERALDVDGDGKVSYTNVQVYKWWQHPAQQWSFYRDPGNSEYYKLGALCTNCFLDVYGAYSADGTNVQMYEYNTSAAQQFVIKRIDMQETQTSEEYEGMDIQWSSAEELDGYTRTENTRYTAWSSYTEANYVSGKANSSLYEYRKVLTQDAEAVRNQLGDPNAGISGVWSIYNEFVNPVEGDTNERKWVQYFLTNVAGYGGSVGGVDGAWGTNTLNCLHDYQSRHGLTVDNGVGSQTRPVMYQELHQYMEAHTIGQARVRTIEYQYVKASDSEDQNSQENGSASEIDVTEPVEENTETEAAEPVEENTETEAAEPVEENTETEAAEPVEENTETEAAEPVDENTETEAAEPVEENTETEAAEPVDENTETEAAEPVEDNSVTEEQGQTEENQTTTAEVPAATEPQPAVPSVVIKDNNFITNFFQIFMGPGSGDRSSTVTETTEVSDDKEIASRNHVIPIVNEAKPSNPVSVIPTAYVPNVQAENSTTYAVAANYMEASDVDTTEENAEETAGTDTGSVTEDKSDAEDANVDDTSITEEASGSTGVYLVPTYNENGRLSGIIIRILYMQEDELRSFDVKLL